MVGRDHDLTNQLSIISGLLISEELEGSHLSVPPWSSKHRTHWPLYLSTFREKKVLMEILRHWLGVSGKEDRPMPLGSAYNSASVGGICVCHHTGRLGWPTYRSLMTLGIELAWWSSLTSSHLYESHLFS